MLQASLVPFPYGGSNPGAGLPWLTSSLIVVCIALAEEIKMGQRDKDTYLKYKGSTPFMFPVSRLVASIVAFPIKIVLGKTQPENRKEIIGTFAIYFVIFILLSLPFVLLNWPPSESWASWPYSV